MSLGCPCSNVPGRRIGALPKELGFGALPRKLGFGSLDSFASAAANPFVSAAMRGPAPVVLPKSVANNVTLAGQMVNAGIKPSAAQAVNIIKTLIPPARGFKANVPAPTVNGKKATSNLSGLSFGVSQVLRRDSFGALGANYSTAASSVANAAPVGSAVKTVASTAAAGAALGSIVPGVGTAIGAAVGAIVGIVEGLFHKKKVSPPISAAEIQQAQTWLNQYTQVAGSVIGRNFTQSAIHDMITAMAIANPGFWGRSSPSQIVVADVTNFVQEEYARIRYFFTALSQVPVGGQVTLKDIPSLPGHGKTNLNVSYTFTNPGVNAPSYILGPYFAQYFYVMCTIFESAGNCAGHLTLPFPQMHCDILDFVRSSNPSWDTPQPNVVTGADVSISAPTVTKEGSATVATATATTLAPAAGAAAVTVTAPVPTAPPPATIQQPTAILQPATPIISPPPTFAPSAAPVANQSTQIPASAIKPSKAGFSWIELAVIGLIGLPILVGMSQPKKRG